MKKKKKSKTTSSIKLISLTSSLKKLFLSVWNTSWESERTIWVKKMKTSKMTKTMMKMMMKKTKSPEVTVHNGLEKLTVFHRKGS